MQAGMCGLAMESVRMRAVEELDWGYFDPEMSQCGDGMCSRWDSGVYWVGLDG